MATIVNERDVILQATTPRMLLVASNFISVTSTTNTFSTTATAISPSSILVRANLSGELRGTVTWAVSPVVPVNITGNVVSVPNTSVVPGTPVTLTATLTLYGQTYTASTVISNIAETVTSGLSANAILISTGTDGTGGNYTSATSTMTVNIGTVDNSSAWTFNWTVPTGVTATGQNTRTITISNMTVDGASLTCVATRTGWPTQTRVLVISKSKAGTVGSKTATIYAYKRSATAPTGADAEPGTVTYSFASNTITTTLTGGWQKTIPTGADPLYVAIATATTTTDTDTVDASEWTDPVLLAQNGANGLNTASVFLYARNSTPGTAPAVATSGNSTYTFSTGVISGQPSGWTRDIPSEASGTVVWVIQATAGSTTATDTIANTEWSTPQILAQRGADGPPGTKTAVIYAYKRSSALPTGADAEPGTVTYSFVSNTITTATLTGGWQKTIPTGTDPLYVVVATAAATTNTDTVDASEWTDPVLLAQNGTSGLNTASVFLYARNSTPGTSPALTTTGSSTYTFTSGTITGQPSGWTRTIPSEASGSVVWVIQATASSTTATDTIVNTEWSTPQILAQQGAQGLTGEGVTQIYIRSDLQPSTPNPSTGTPSGWSSTVAGAAGTAAVWTSFGNRLVGSTVYTWQTPVRVQGEAGNPLRNASGFLYYSQPQASAPSAPSASGFNFSNGTFNSVSSNWSTTFNVPSGTTTKLWAVRYSVQETAFGGAQTVSISNPFTHQNFDGLVTFTNNSYVDSSGATSIANSAANTAVSNASGNYATNNLSNVTTIDGGKITTGSLTANKLEIGKPRTGDYIRMFDNKIVVYTGNIPRVIIGNLS
jgi:hypothetical protein